MSCHVLSCLAMQGNVMSCHVMPCHGVECASTHVVVVLFCVNDSMFWLSFQTCLLCLRRRLLSFPYIFPQLSARVA